MNEISNFKKALIKGEIVLLLTQVSKSGMRRHFKVFYYHNKQYLPIPNEIASKLANGLDKNGKGIRIDGCGMDMSFALWKSIVDYFKLNYQKLGQSYRVYTSYEDFMFYDKHMKNIIKL